MDNKGLENIEEIKLSKQKIAIIIPAYNSGKFLDMTIKNLLKTTKHPHWRLIISMSKSDDMTEAICDYYSAMYPSISVIKSPKEGTTKALNKAIKATTEDEDILLTQDDVLRPDLYKHCWLTRMLTAVEKNPDAGLITTMEGGGVSGPDYVDGFRWIGTWNMYIPRRTLNKVGLFDENFNPGPGDDIDYSFRVFLSGLNLGQISIWVEHHRKMNFNDHSYENEDIKSKNAKYFRQKFKQGEFKDA